jgi:hypothetical protein
VKHVNAKLTDAPVIGYTVGLILTFIGARFLGAQPALMYLVPTVLVSGRIFCTHLMLQVLMAAWRRNIMKKLWNMDVDCSDVETQIEMQTREEESNLQENLSESEAGAAESEPVGVESSDEQRLLAVV